MHHCAVYIDRKIELAGWKAHTLDCAFDALIAAGLSIPSYQDI